MIAATNRPDVIDPAYLRYKRFSHLIHVTPPDLEAKRAIIESKLEGIALDGVTAEDVLDMTERLTVKDTPLGRVSVREAYYSAADICGIVEEACRLALEQLQAAKSKTPIPLTRAMFEKAFEKIPAEHLGKGPERVRRVPVNILPVRGGGRGEAPAEICGRLACFLKNRQNEVTKQILKNFK